jgi:hypothetical protein
MNRKKLKSIDAKPMASRTICNSNIDDLSAFSLKISKKIKSLDYQIAELENFILYLNAEQKSLNFKNK